MLGDCLDVSVSDDIKVMAENSNISWTHHTFNPWVGCDKVAPECSHCYIDRVLRQQGREPWGALYRTKTWSQPLQWERQAAKENKYYRVFTCSLSDFFHVKADAWRPEAWEIIKTTPHLIYLILTKRPELMSKRLPNDWGDGYPNVWLGVSSGCKPTLNKMDALRLIPAAKRFLSAEPLLEDITPYVCFDGFDWVITGGESGSGKEYRWSYDPKEWRKEFNTGGRRTMEIDWAMRLLCRCRVKGLPFFFKQITSARPGQGEDALGKIIQEFPAISGDWGRRDAKKS